MDTIEIKQLLNRVTLSFNDPHLEERFLHEYQTYIIHALKVYSPWTTLIFFLTAITTQLFFPNLHGFLIFCIGMLAIMLLLACYVRFAPLTTSIELILSMLSVLLGWLYTYVLIVIDIPSLNIYVSGVAIHIAAISIFLRFFYSAVVMPTIWFGFGVIVFIVTDINRFYALWQFLFLGALSFFCLLNSYLRENSMRKSFYQKHVIEEREKELADEREKSERLLLNILPKSVAERLKKHQHIIADAFDETTILFADIVGFTRLSEQIPAQELVAVLNTIFTMFDTLTDTFGVEKIKTIGDAYMVAAGLPEHRTDHAQVIASMALEMCRAMATYNVTAPIPLQIRIGIHSGSVIAGVIGKKKFTYDLWGDTVNTASRMESHGIPGQIQVTQSAYELLKNEFIFYERGIIDVKGKGAMKVYLLNGSHESVAVKC